MLLSANQAHTAMGRDRRAETVMLRSQIGGHTAFEWHRYACVHNVLYRTSIASVTIAPTLSAQKSLKRGRVVMSLATNGMESVSRLVRSTTTMTIGLARDQSALTVRSRSYLRFDVRPKCVLVSTRHEYLPCSTWACTYKRS